MSVILVWQVPEKTKKYMLILYFPGTFKILLQKCGIQLNKAECVLNLYIQTF